VARGLENGPKIGLPAGPRGSDEWPQMPAVCEVPARPKSAKKNVSDRETGGGKLTRRKHSFRWGSLNDHVGARRHHRGACKQGRGPLCSQDGDEGARPLGHRCRVKRAAPASARRHAVPFAFEDNGNEGVIRRSQPLLRQNEVGCGGSLRTLFPARLRARSGAYHALPAARQGRIDFGAHELR
jgi:hypothetical protein